MARLVFWSGGGLPWPGCGQVEQSDQVLLQPELPPPVRLDVPDG